jgi:hypothetical protein
VRRDDLWRENARLIGDDALHFYGVGAFDHDLVRRDARVVRNDGFYFYGVGPLDERLIVGSWGSVTGGCHGSILPVGKCRQTSA